MAGRARTANLVVALVATAVLAVAGGSARAHAAGLHSAGVAGPCPGRTRVLCGTVRVPLYWSDPHGATLSVAFHVYLHSDDSQPALEPIVAMEGGPGYPSIGSAGSYLAMIGPLRARHDLIVMDNRGTGASGAVRCPSLQRYDGLSEPGRVAALVAACQRRLGDAANAYGTNAVGDDLAYILHRLGVSKIDIYGDSYGDFSAQVFTLHHPDLVRAMVLDGSYNDEYNPFEPEAAAAMRNAWTLLCARSTACHGQPILSEIGAFSRYLVAHPLRGISRDADGDVIHVDLTAPAFAQLVFDATYFYTPFTDLPAALRAFAAGNRTPMLRLAAEDVAENESGGAFGYSVGDLEVVSCHDYPTVWKQSAPIPQRRAELSAAIAALPPDTFAPFSKSVYLASYDENQLVFGCLDWKPPVHPDPPFPAGLAYPHTPVLIFDGQFDQATPVADAKKVAASWPDSTFVEVANANHVTAEGDLDGCTSVILQHFLRTLSAGSTACAAAMPPVNVVSAFPERLAAAPAAAGSGSPLARRVAWVTAQTVGDAFARWFNLMSTDTGHGLYGGSYTVEGTYESTAPVTIALDGSRFVRDLAVTGDAVWNRTTRTIAATLTVRSQSGRAGTLTLHWDTGVYTARAPATVTGTFAGSHVSVHLAAPWSPES